MNGHHRARPTGPAAAASGQVWGRQAAAGGVSAAGGFGGFLMAKCTFENCTANAMADGSGRCYWHNDNISEGERQRSRAAGGRATRRIEPWQLPEDLQPIHDLAGLKNLYNSALAWLTTGVITPAQAHSLRALAGGLRDCFELEIYQELVAQRRELLEQAQQMGIAIDIEKESEDEKWLLPGN